MKKGIMNISCASGASTAICNSMEPMIPSSYSSSSSSSSSSLLPPMPSSVGGGGRAIDRHNPIIANGRRLIVAGATGSSSTSDANTTDHRSDDQVQTSRTVVGKPKSKSKGLTTNKIKRNTEINVKQQLINLGKKKKTKAASASAAASNRNGEGPHHKSYSAAAAAAARELRLMKGCTALKPGEDYVSPPESSRFLLDDPGLDDHLDGLSDLLDDPILGIRLRTAGGDDRLTKEEAEEDDGDVIDDVRTAGYEKKGTKTKTTTAPPPPVSSAANSPHHQVVVLRVSLHCKGCEGKVRKHISKMQGVASFNINFAEKKVTVIGDVTPLGVLSSISKVKNAQLLTMPAPPSTPSLDATTTMTKVEEAVTLQ